MPMRGICRDAQRVDLMQVMADAMAGQSRPIRECDRIQCVLKQVAAKGLEIGK